MAGTLLNFSQTDITVRYKAPFISEGLNLKSLGAIARGVKRGFILNAPGAGNRMLEFLADASTGDSAAVIETMTGHSIHVLRPGDFQIDLTSLSGQTLVIAIYASYALGAITTATIRHYTVSEYEAAPEKDSLVVLGTVTVPGTAVPFLPSQVTHTRRTYAWREVPPQEVPWVQVLVNPAFEHGKTNSVAEPTAIAGWANKAGLYKQTVGVGLDGTNAVQAQIAASPASGSLQQDIHLPVTSDSLLLVKARIRVLIAPTVAVLTNLELLWNENGTPLTTTSIPLVSVASTDGSYREIEQVVVPPTMVGTSAVLTSVRVRMDAQTWASTGTVFSLDGVEVYLDRYSHETMVAPAAPVVSSKITLLSENSPTQSLVDITNVLDEGAGGQAAVGVTRFTAERIEDTPLTGDDEGRSTRVDTAADDAWLLHHVVDAAADGDFRVYVRNQGRVDDTSNAFWNNGTSLWAPDVSTAPSSRVRRGINGDTRLAVEQRWNFAGGTFAESAWKPIFTVNDPHHVNVKPILQVGTRGNYNRNLVDRFGLPFSRVTEFRENWMTAALDTNMWDANIFGAGAVNLNDYAPLLSPALELSVGGGGSDVAEVLTVRTPFYASLAANVIHVMECEVVLTAVAIGDLTFRIGFWTPGGDGIAAEYNPGANANWGIYTADGLTITHDYSVIPVVSDTVYRLRLELVGSGSGHAGPYISLYVNGNIAFTKNTGLPTIGWCPIGTRLEDTDPTTAGGDVRISPILANSIRTLADDNV